MTIKRLVKIEKNIESLIVNLKRKAKELKGDDIENVPSFHAFDSQLLEVNKGELIYIIDDCKDIINYLKLVISNLGYRLETFNNIADLELAI